MYFKGGCDKRRENENTYKLMKLRQKKLRDLWQIKSAFSEVEGQFICVKELGEIRHMEKIKGDVIKSKKVLI